MKIGIQSCAENIDLGKDGGTGRFISMCDYLNLHEQIIYYAQKFRLRLSSVREEANRPI